MRFTPSDGSVNDVIREACGKYAKIAWGEDAEQEAHLRIYQLLDREFRDWDHFRAWVHRVVKITMLQLRNGGYRQKKQEPREDPYDGVAHPYSEGDGETQILRGAVSDALERMPAVLRPYVDAYAMTGGQTGGWGCAEIARVLGENRNTVAARVKRAFGWLREELLDE